MQYFKTKLVIDILIIVLFYWIYKGYLYSGFKKISVMRAQF